MALILAAVVAIAAAQENSVNSIIEAEQPQGYFQRAQNFIVSTVIEPIRRMDIDWNSMLNRVQEFVVNYLQPERRAEPKNGEYMGENNAQLMARQLFEGARMVATYMTSR